MKSEMRDPSALTEADLNEYTRWLAQPGGTRTIMEVYRAAEEDGAQNKRLFEKKLDIPVLAVGGDFFFGEVPRKQMEQVRPRKSFSDYRSRQMSAELSLDPAIILLSRSPRSWRMHILLS